MNHKIGFIGLGLIGGSIARAVRQYFPDYEIVAFDKNKETLALATQESVIDVAATTIDDNFRNCRYLFLCAPVSYNTAYLRQIREYLHDDCILTDVGSVKTNIHKEVEALGIERYFIGGHPMAGSEKSGYINSRAMLIENAYFVLTPTNKVSAEKIARYEKFVQDLHAIPVLLDHQEHDYVTAAISHVPHLVAAALANLVHDHDSAQETMKMIAAGGFKDITRIASSSPDMWESICMSNTENIANLLDDYIVSLQTISSAVRAKQNGFTYDLFAASKEYRDSFSDLPRGPITKVFACYVDIPDEAGAIASIASLLAQAGISIKNIGIIHNRDFEEGVLRVEFYEQTALNEAVTLLRSLHYSIYHRK